MHALFSRRRHPAQLVRHNDKRRRRAPAQKESESDTSGSSSAEGEDEGTAGKPTGGTPEGSSESSGSESGSEADGEGVGEMEEGTDGSSSEEAEAEPERVIQYKWSLSKDDKHYFQQDHAKVVCAAFHKPSGVLTAGFTNGVFGLYELPDFSNIHTLSISQRQINTVAVNATGEWLCFGTGTMGQLLVWEWQSETYVLKQQGHFFDMNVLDYSPNGQNIATGGDDGKVKLWNTSSGFCYVTFKEHTGGISSVKFAPNGMAVVSASLDGTVRAFDLMRYRNFRTFTTPRPVQFSCLAVDHSGEIICAGCQDDYDIYVWSMQTGKLLDVMAGHEVRLWLLETLHLPRGRCPRPPPRPFPLGLLPRSPFSWFTPSKPLHRRQSARLTSILGAPFSRRRPGTSVSRFGTCSRTRDHASRCVAHPIS